MDNNRLTYRNTQRNKSANILEMEVDRDQMKFRIKIN